jgi:hypothetical protein
MRPDVQPSLDSCYRWKPSMKGSWVASPSVIEVFPKQSISWNGSYSNAFMVITINKLTPPRILFRPIDSQIWESRSARLASCLKNGEKGCNTLRLVLWHWLKLSMIPVRFEFLAGGISSHLKWFVIFQRRIALKRGGTRYDSLDYRV